MKSSSERNYEPSGAANTGGLAPLRYLSIDHSDIDRERGWLNSLTKTAPDDCQGLFVLECDHSHCKQAHRLRHNLPNRLRAFDADERIIEAAKEVRQLC